jgi:hypothetical protein
MPLRGVRHFAGHCGTAVHRVIVFQFTVMYAAKFEEYSAIRFLMKRAGRYLKPALRALPKCTEEKAPITAAPNRQTKNETFGPSTTGHLHSNSKPAMKFRNPHAKLTAGDDKPTPLGFANGVGNEEPCNPHTRCGAQLQKNAPIKK